MAYDQHYRPASQNSVFGLCSSQSYLDGVPFKISSAFRPSAQPAVPPQLLRPCQPCEAFHTEYAYDTEEAVLAWSRAREEAKAKAVAEREAAERRKAALAAADSRSSDSEEDSSEGVADSSAQARTVAKTSQPEAQPVKPPWQLPVGASLTNTILTPTPSQSFQKKVQSPLAPQHPVDLALFEQEDDPFDNMELQTLNDMEELRTLLGGGSQGPSPNPDSQVAVGSVSDRHSDGQTVSAQGEATQQVNGQSSKSSPTNIFTSIPGVKMFQKTPPDSVSCSASQTSNAKNKSAALPYSSAAAPSTEASTDKDYVRIRSDYSQQAVHFQKDSAHANGKPTSENVARGGGGELAHQHTNGKVCKTALPPIRPRGKSLSGEGIDGMGSDGGSSSLSSEAQPVPRPRQSFQGGGMSQSAYVMSSSSSSSCKEPALSDFFTKDGLPAYTSPSGGPPHSKPAGGGGASTALGHNPYSRHGNVGCDSPAGQVNGVRGDRAGLRSAKSNPDLLVRNTSPAQAWNPYTPLPPTPVPSLRPDSCSPEAMTEQGHSPSPPPAAAAVSSTTRAAGSSPNQSDYDPYPSLSSQAKTFVTNLTSMGFSRSRVSRAVEKFGTDEREVLDHLLNVDKLVEKRFTPALAETSLQLFKNNIHQAEQFLNLYRQFSELGFSEDRIKTALVKHQLDRDRALDDLTT